MNRKLIFLTSIVVLLSCFSAANAAVEIKCDMVVTLDGNEVPWTFKGAEPGYEEWHPLLRWGNDKETHDGYTFQDIGGKVGYHMFFSMGYGSSNPGTVLDFSVPGDGRICNTWIRTSDSADASIVIGGPGFLPGNYEVYGYHISDGGSEPNMPTVTVKTFNMDDAYMHNVSITPDGHPSQTEPHLQDGVGVVVEFNDVDVPIMHVTDDALLEEHRSHVRFYTDGSPVRIIYEAGAGSTAVLNAVIFVISDAPPEPTDPSPRAGGTNVCPDVELTWEPGKYIQDVKGEDV
jgi:hypothetical protein